AEGKAISQLFNGVPVSSTKSMMGHSLGAAGAIEAVISLLALRHQFLPPNINFEALDESLDLNVVANESRSAAVRIAISNSFGFGGTNASILIRRVEASVSRSPEWGGRPLLEMASMQYGSVCFEVMRRPQHQFLSSLP